MDIERVGTFYLGREVDPVTGGVTERDLLYDANDLTTHAVIVGMTGSGKTGLGIDLIEEAALDGVPVLAVDPKGDLGNLALAFPALAPADFRPWIDPLEAQRDGLSLAEAAARTAETWREGLAGSGQTPDRIARLRAAAEVRLYTPGSSAGRELSVLRSFAPPSAGVADDDDLFRDRVAATATGLLALLGIDADPLSSREHILLASLFEHAWRAGRPLDIAGLIGAVQDPPMRKIGVLDLATVYPAADRMRLALQLNNLLAAPSFAAWTRGEPLDIQGLLYARDGKPRVAVLSIAHLSDAERMFFLSLLLTEVISWMRAQSGTGSLRALLYIDELFGFMPPVANPPTKKPLLTLLKQARAFGLGLALSTQNPVDLDYKGLSNAGTWFVGRLQTERDKSRLAEGLRAAAPDAPDAATLASTIAGLGKRTFLLHNVHDALPVVFQTRWAMSYLAGPLTRDQIHALAAARDEPEAPALGATDPERSEGAAADPHGSPEATPAAPTAAGPSPREPITWPPGAPADAPPTASPPAAMAPPRPLLPPDVPQLFAPANDPPDGVTYLPFVFGAADVHYASKTHDIATTRRLARLVEPVAGPVPVEWAEGRSIDVDLAILAARPLEGAAFNELPPVRVDAAAVRGWTRSFSGFLRNDAPLNLWRCAEARLTSEPGETERDFRVRCAHAVREARDTRREALRARYATKVKALKRRRLNADQVVQREAQQAQQRKLDAAITVGSALLGSFLGRRAPSSSRVGTAMRSVNRIQKESGDVARAKESSAALATELEALQGELERELAELTLADPGRLELDPVAVHATSTNIQVRYLGLLWLPFTAAAGGGWSGAGPLSGE